MIEPAKFTYSPLEKALEKQKKIIEEQGKKQVEALEVLKPELNKEGIKWNEGLFPKEMKTNEIKNEIDETKKWADKIKRKDLKYETNKHIHVYDFQQFWNFGDNIYTGKISIDEAKMDQSNLLGNMVEFNDKNRPKKEENGKKEILLIL